MSQPETTGNRHGKRRVAATVLLLALLSAGVLLLTPRSKVAENIQKQAAKIRKTEYIPRQRGEISGTAAYAQQDSLYSLFRKKFRFHYQGIGTASFPDSSRLLLIAEPPPYFEADSLPALFRGFNIRVERKKHRLGYDGHITDLIVTVENATEQNLQNRIRRLSELLYFSDYKCPVIPLQKLGNRRHFTRNQLDYRINLEEINSWFLSEPERFMTLGDTARTYTLQELLTARKYGVFFSVEPGFVVWTLPKHCDLSENRQDIRPFTLDADLILAAISDSSSLAIIGREREAALEELPPLQVETILLLASIRDKELSQSLDVNDLMAGKMGNGKDWCPTYLSRELENTELGSLLTMTDIILKDWSESGTIQEHYYRYPHPSYYPFPQPLFEWLGVPQLVYNWNTEDVMYAIDTEGKTLYALNRTGALPVSYFLSPDRATSAGSRYERKAWQYFATCGNTDLARVVQYTALYQLFIDNDIRYGDSLRNHFPTQKPYLLADEVRRLLAQIDTLSDPYIRFITDSVTRWQFEGFHRSRIDREIAAADAKYGMEHSEAEKEEIRQQVLKEQQSAMYRQFKSIQQLLASLSEEGRTRLVRFLAYPRGSRIRTAEQYRTYRQAESVKELLHNFGKNNLPLIGTELSAVRDRYCARLAGNAAPYLKTPSCVVTYHDFYTTGGHNLSSRIHRVHSMSGYRSASTDADATYYPAPQPAKSEPAPEKVATAPAKKTPAQAHPSAQPATGGTPAAPAKTTTAKKSGGPTPKATTQPASRTAPAASKNGVRSRSSVISAQPRTQRGL